MISRPDSLNHERQFLFASELKKKFNFLINFLINLRLLCTACIGYAIHHNGPGVELKFQKVMGPFTLGVGRPPQHGSPMGNNFGAW